MAGTTRLLSLVLVLLAPAVLWATEAEHVDAERTSTMPSAAAVLAGLDETRRADALIQLELVGSEHSDTLPARAAEISSWWNQGRHDQAVVSLGQLEVEGASFAVSVSWSEPIVSAQKRWYSDVRIGAPRVDADDVALDYHAETNHLFAAVTWGGFGWSMNISTDNGASWAETYVYSSVPCRIHMVVAGDHAWVCYSPLGTADQVRMRRFDVATGAVDTAYSHRLVDDVSPHIATDLTLGTNADDFDNRVFPAVITSGDDLRFYWADLNGETFNEMSPPVSTADTGLDFTWNKHGTSGYVAFMSFLGTGGGPRVWRVDLFGSWEQVFGWSFSGYHEQTAISAYQGHVYVALEHEYTEGYGIKYWVSRNDGENWTWNDLYEPAPGEPDCWRPDVSARSGVGSALVFNREDGSFDHVYHMTRHGYGNDPWSGPSSDNDHDAVSGSRNVVEWIGSSCVMSYGVVYLAEGHIPYFDVLKPNAFFCDGFESGDLSAW